jgi:molybdate/tungstate transport system substrate-binding protein
MADLQLKSRVRIAAIAGLAAAAVAVAGCSSSSSPSGGSSASASSSASSAASAPTKPTGNVNVAYASSLQFLNEKIVSPAFTQAEGYKFVGHGGASTELANDITSGELTPDVFESVGGDNIKLIEPKFTNWYVQYAGTSIVLAYNPKSKYAADFKAVANGSKNVCSLFSSTLQSPGFKLGRTDPNIDPQGRDFIMMVELAQSYCHLPSDTAAKILGTSDFGTANSSQIYAESSLDSTLQSGQLDAASAFITQAVELKLPYIKLPDQINLGSAAEKAAYAKATVKVKNGKTYKGSPQVIDITTVGAKPSAAAIAFVKYTLSSAGLAQYSHGGFTVLTPKLTGSMSAVPAAIASELGG